MAHGTPDYGMTKETRTVHAVAEYGEAAIRQGAVSSVDRRGNVIEYDDFEAATMKWGFLLGLGVVQKSDNVARSSDYSVMIQPGPDAEDASGINKSFFYTVPSNLGAEIWFLWEVSPIRITLLMEIRDATGQYDATIRYNTNTNTLDYDAGGGVWVPLETYPFTLETDIFWPMKLVCNSINHEYVRCIFMENEYNLANIPMNVAGPAGTSYVTVEVEIEALEDGGALAYVDDFILTQNEP